MTNEDAGNPAIDCWYLTGATASGKTAVGIEMAKLLDAEIISLDSMAIYRGMDVGTAKPSSEQLSTIPHHMIDICDPVETFSVSQYCDAALEKISEIRQRGKEVLIVGGTALYLKVLLRGMFDGPPADWEFRKQVEAELADVSNEHLYERLKNVDPVAAHKLHPNDRRRLIRALEVFKQTGQPISHFQMQFDEGLPEDQVKVFTLRHPRPILHERIEVRVDWMFDYGLIEEVQSLLDKWNELSHTASQAVGYREVMEHIAGERDREETVEKVRVRTRRFARHQETWFRGLSECRMIDLDESATTDPDPVSIATRLIELGTQTVAESDV
ncbi:MAG: tRNA (adenosine(37)-N6)-dimethylallyltransferase MiaA [Planctomycetota bacterium]